MGEVKMCKKTDGGDDFPNLFPPFQLWNCAAVTQHRISERNFYFQAGGPGKYTLWAEECGEKPCSGIGSSTLSPLTLFLCFSLHVLQIHSPNHQALLLQHRYGHLKPQRKKKCPEKFRKWALSIKSVNPIGYFSFFSCQISLRTATVTKSSVTEQEANTIGKLHLPYQ